MKPALMLIIFLAAFIVARAQSSANQPTPDIRTYKTVGATKVPAHIFRPQDDARGKPLPVIVLFHGGGWVAGSPDWVYETAQRYASYGAVAIAAEYRLCDQTAITPLDSLADARDLIAWLQANSKELGINPSLLAVYGVSAGGQLAAALATIPDPVRPNAALGPVAMVMISPAVSVVHAGWFQRILMGKATAASLSPDEHINGRIPPTVIFHGAADTLVPISGVRGFCQRAQKFASDCEIVEYPGVGHLFTRKLDSQESDFDPDPSDVADARARGDGFLAAHGILPLFKFLPAK
jgi:acetyl esterase